MEIAQIFGWLATCASTISFTPQAWKIIKTRETHDISASMYVITVLGFSFWTAYGVLLQAWPIVVTNTICFLLSGFILVMKLLPQRQRQEVADVLDPTAD